MSSGNVLTTGLAVGMASVIASEGITDAPKLEEELCGTKPALYEKFCMTDGQEPEPYQPNVRQVTPLAFGTSTVAPTTTTYGFKVDEHGKIYFYGS